MAIPVQIRVRGCDAHAVGQSSKTYEFKVWAAVGDRESQHVKLYPDEPFQDALEALIDECIRVNGVF